ncbi:MAG: nucleotidyltransferase domain-containing protein [Candidatus Odinarchaeia archaeon]
MASVNFNVKLPGRVKKYLNFVNKVIVKSIGEKPIAILLFGSYVNQTIVSKQSDVDLIIIVDDGVSEKKLSKARRHLYYYEKKLFNLRKTESFIDKILFHIGNSTGMFKSFFICRESDFLSLNFDSIFNVNRFFSFFLAPKNIVLASSLLNSKLIYGSIEEKQINIDIDFLQVIRSLIMCLTLALSTIGLLPFSNTAINYYYESVKWSVLNTYFYLRREKSLFKKGLEFFRELIYISEQLFTALKYFRRTGIFPKNKLLEIIPLILRLHLISPKKYVKRYTR